jgi:hypothetical protein
MTTSTLPTNLEELRATPDDLLGVVRHTPEVRKLVRDIADKIARDGSRCEISTDLLGWFIARFAKDVDEAQARKQKAEADAADNTRKSTVQAARDAARANGMEIAKTLLQEFPAIVRCPDNYTVLGDALDAATEKDPEFIPDFSAAVQIFRDLARAGKLRLNPKFVGGANEVLQPGQAKNYPKLEQMLISESEKSESDAKAEQRRINGLSATDFRREQMPGVVDANRAVYQPEDSAQRNILRQQGAQAMLAVDTFFSQCPEYIPSPDNKEKVFAYLEEHGLGLTIGGLQEAFEAVKGDLELKPVLKSNSLTHTVYDTPRHQDPTAGIDKAALRAMIAKMDSQTYQKWLSTASPAQRRAIDGD